MYYVYALLDPRKPLTDFDFTHEPIYIGMGKRDRMHQHNNLSDNKILSRKILHIESAGLELIRIKIEENLTKEDAANLEISLIERYGKICEKNGTLCNIADGGIGGDVIHCHPDRDAIYKKINETKKANKTGQFSDGWGSWVHLRAGVPLSQKHRDSISKFHADISGENNPMWGKTHTEQTKDKMKESKAKFYSDPVKRADFFKRVSEGNNLRGKTYEDVYGKEKADIIKSSRSESMKLMRAKMKEEGPRVWMNKDGVIKRVLEKDLEQFYSDGWVKGRK